VPEERKNEGVHPLVVVDADSRLTANELEGVCSLGRRKEFSGSKKIKCSKQKEEKRKSRKGKKQKE